MDTKALNVALDAMNGDQFRVARDLVRRALADEHVRITSALPRLIPAAELADIYSFRSARAKEQGTLVPGLAETARVFETSPAGRWRIVGVQGDQIGAVLFLNEAGVCEACFAGEVHAGQI